MDLAARFFEYVGYATVACTVADKLIDAARAYAKSTPSPDDDAAVEKAAGWVDQAHSLISYFAVLKGKK